MAVCTVRKRLLFPGTGQLRTAPRLIPFAVRRYRTPDHSKDRIYASPDGLDSRKLVKFFTKRFRGNDDLPSQQPALTLVGGRPVHDPDGLLGFAGEMPRGR